MHKTFKFENARFSVETHFATLILLERVKLTDIEKPAHAQNFFRLPV